MITTSKEGMKDWINLLIYSLINGWVKDRSKSRSVLLILKNKNVSKLLSNWSIHSNHEHKQSCDGLQGSMKLVEKGKVKFKNNLQI